MLSTPKAKSGLFLASSLCDGLEDNNIRQVATLILNKDADPNILIPTHGVTPFHLVIGNDSEAFAEEVTKLFLRHGGDPNVKSNDGMTPVHVAAAWGRTNILELLLANGGDPLCLDNEGRSPFHYAYDGKYFKAVTMLGKYCENIEEVNEKPKYNIMLDKVLVSNGDIVAEYVTSQDTILDIDLNVTNKNTFTDFYNRKSNVSSMTAKSISTTHIRNDNERTYKKPNILDSTVDSCRSMKKRGRPKLKKPIKINEYPSLTDDDTVTHHQNKLPWKDNAGELNHSLIDLDFDFANLQLSDVIEKEKSLVNKIISQLSTTLSDIPYNESSILNYKRNKPGRSNIAINDSDISIQLMQNKNTRHKRECYKNRKFTNTANEYVASTFKHKTVTSNNRNNDILKFKTPNMKKKFLKYDTENTTKKRHKEISQIPLIPNYALDKSIITMSPNFNTPIPRKKRDLTKALSTSYIYDDSIISKSPNFVTAIQRKREIPSSVDEYISPKICKFDERKIPVQYSEFNRYKKHIAQSTPRRKKRSIYKRHSRRFDFYKQEDDTIQHMPVTVNFLETNESTTSYEILDTSDELPLNHKFSEKKRNNYFNNRLAIKLDEGKYDEDSTTCDNTDCASQVDLNEDISCNQMKKRIESNNYDCNKKFTKSESNQMDTRFVTMKKNIYEIDSTKKTTDTDNVRFVCAIESNSSNAENFVDCIDCDTKKLLNEDLEMNINKTCNLHTNNWCNNRSHEFSSHKLITENNASPIANLPTKCRKQICFSDSHKSYSSRINNNNDNTNDYKKSGNILKEVKDLDTHKLDKNSTILSYVSTQEEYKYEDPEEGVILLERRLYVTPLSIFSESEHNSKTSISGISKISQSLPKELLIIDNATLRKELTEFGNRPGPITNTTRHVYLKRLMQLKNAKDVDILSRLALQNNDAELNNRMKSYLKFGDWTNHLETYASLEKQVFQEFALPDPSRRWREGISKTCFTYFLLDSRITRDLPRRSIYLTESDVWTTFLNAIFYIGKGKRSRPFAHLYDAFNTWVSKMPITSNKKINRILDIWNDDQGVICLHVFQNVIPVEAYTREAAMIDAIGTEYLSNCKSGEYYGIAATWSIKQKQKFGRYLLYKALQILLHEGERQLFPQNL